MLEIQMQKQVLAQQVKLLLDVLGFQLVLHLEQLEIHVIHVWLVILNQVVEQQLPAQLVLK